MTRAELVEAMAIAAWTRASNQSRDLWVNAHWIDDAFRDHVRDVASHVLAAIEAAGFAVVPAGLWQTLHNGLNCVIHEEDNDPPDVANAVRIARATLDEARAMIAASPVDARDE